MQEDYSHNGDAELLYPRSRPLARLSLGEEGTSLAFPITKQHLCFALALWERDNGFPSAEPGSSGIGARRWSLTAPGGSVRVASLRLATQKANRSSKRALREILDARHIDDADRRNQNGGPEQNIIIGKIASQRILRTAPAFE